MQFLKANTGVDVRIGPFVDVGDGFTPETGVTLSGADEAELLKHNGAATVDISGRTFAAVSGCDGWYDLTLTTSDTDTEGLLDIVVQDDSVCLPVHARFMVLAEAAYDSMFTAKDTGYMDVNVKAVSEDTTAADNLESACDNYSATRGLSGTALPDAAADAAGGLPISDAGNLDLDTYLGRITGNVALASVLGALTDAAADGDPTTADTLMQYIKQLINVLIGTTGVTTFPAEAAPANNVSLAEVIRAIHADVTGLNGDAMRGTDSAALASVCTEARLAELAAANIPADVDTLLTRLSAANAQAIADWIDGGRLDLLLDAVKAVTDALPNSGALTDIDTGVNNIEAKLPSKSYLMGSADADGGFDTEAKADVNSEVSDVMKTDTISEMSQGIPPTTPTFEEAVMYLYMALTKKIDVDASLKEFYNNAGTVIWKKALADDGTNYNEDKGQSGP